MHHKMRYKADPEPESAGGGAVSSCIGSQRALFTLQENGISRTQGTAEKDPTVHPETPRNNPTRG